MSIKPMREKLILKVKFRRETMKIFKGRQRLGILKNRKNENFRVAYVFIKIFFKLKKKRNLNATYIIFRIKHDLFIVCLYK